MKLALAIALLAASGPTLASDAFEMRWHATYLGAPTDWCPAETGMPFLIKLDGPDVDIAETEGVTVRVRRGQSLNEYRLHPAGPLKALELDGRLSGEFKACKGPWGSMRGSGTWAVLSEDGSEVAVGSVQDVYFPFSFSTVKRTADSRQIEPDEILFARFGGSLFYTKAQLKRVFSHSYAPKLPGDVSQ